MNHSAASVLAGRYRLVEPLGAGGMGVVWAAERLEDGVRVAVKLMKSAPDDAGLRRRFLREARAVTAIQHPNVVRIFEVLELEHGAPAIVMEQLTGETLAARIQRAGALPLCDVAHVMLLVVSAVGAAHALGIVHRDLKPDNIFLIPDADGTTDVKVLDFGIAKLTLVEGQPGASAGATTTGSFLGTPAYMSPEQVFGERDIDHRTDLWSVGMILYESLSGILPTREENLGQIIKIILTRSNWRFGEVAPDVPEPVKDLVRRLLQRARSRRPSLHDVAEVLRQYSDTAAPSFGAPAVSTPGSSRRSKPGPSQTLALASTIAVSGPRRPRRTTLVAAAATSAVLAVGSTWIWLENRKTDTEASAEITAAETSPESRPTETSPERRPVEKLQMPQPAAPVASEEPPAAVGAVPASSGPRASAPAATARRKIPPPARGSPPQSTATTDYVWAER